MTIVSETRSAWQIEQGKKCGCRGLDDYCPCQNTDRTTAAPPTNTAGLVAEIDAEMQGRRRGYADVRGELLFRCRDSLVTAASAQARIAELEAALAAAQNADAATIKALITELRRARGLLKDLADELEGEVQARYDGVKDHPAMTPKYCRDLEPVVSARAFLARNGKGEGG